MRRLVISVLALTSLAGCRLLRHEESRGDNTLVLPEETADALEAVRETRALDRACEQAVAAVLVSHRDVSPEAVAVAVIDFTNPRRPRLGQVHGFEGFAASELAALPLACELMRQRAMGHLTEHQVAGPVTEMLVNGDAESINAAIDALTSTESGDTLIGPALETFLDNRRRIDRSLFAQGLFGVSVTHHLDPQGHTGREAQASERLAPAENEMTAAATARLLYLAGTGNIISRSGAAQLYGTMQRPAGAEAANSRMPVDLPENTRVWGLAAWSRLANHGACLLALPGGQRLAVAALTRPDRDDPALVRALLEELVRQCGSED